MADFVIRTGNEWPQIIPTGSGGSSGLPISYASISVGTAQILNFVGAGVSVAVDGGDPNQINVTIPGGGGGGVVSVTAGAGLINSGTAANPILDVGAGFGITVGVNDVAVNTAAVFTGANAWTGDHQFDGNVTLGSSAADTITFNGQIVNSLIPNVDNTYDLGSTSLRWKTLHVGPGSVVVHSDATDTEKITLEAPFSAHRLHSVMPGFGTLTISASDATTANAGGNGITLHTGEPNGVGPGARLAFETTGVSSGGGIVGNVVINNSSLIFARELNHSFVIPSSVTAGVAGGNWNLTTGAGATDAAGGGTFFQLGAGGIASVTAGGAGGGYIFAPGVGGSGAVADKPGGNAGSISFGNNAAGGAGGATAISGNGAGFSVACGSPGVNNGGGVGFAGSISMLTGIGRSAAAAGASPNASNAGTFSIGARTGGAASAVGTAGVGSTIIGTGGNGGAASAVIAAGAGGPISWVAGNGGSNALGGGGGVGGGFTADAGAGTGVAAGGTMNLGTTNAEIVNIGRTGKTINLLGDVSFAGNVLPAVDNTLDLGSTTLRWKTLHVGPGSVVVHNDATDTEKVTLGFSGPLATLLTSAATQLGIAVGAAGAGIAGGGASLAAGASGAGGGTGGSLILGSGVGGASTGIATGGAGGQTSVVSAAGGAGAGGFGGGGAGQISLLGANGGAGTVAAAAGAGANISALAGNGGTDNGGGGGVGGNFTADAGAGTGVAANGTVSLGTTSAAVINIGRVGVIPKHQGGGTDFANGAALAVSTASRGVVKYNNTLKGFQGSSDTAAYAFLVDTRANANDTELTTTGATTIATFTPPVAGNYVVEVYFRVITGATAVTITITWTDSSGAQTSTLVAAAPPSAVDSYIVTPTYIDCTAAAITVTATAGVANRVFVSSSIVRVS